ncbi:MAG: A/G-specific adenine glycosylase [Pseudomonadota bacterium]
MAGERQARKNLSRPAVNARPGAAARVLAWYDKNARALPWRVGPSETKRGARPDPYRVWLSEIMLQQTTVATVTPRFHDFLEQWPTVEALAAAPLDDVLGAWAGLGYYARARNLHACAQAVVNNHDGVFPDTEEGLRALPGVGDYTAAAVAAIAFARRAVVVDGNIERVVSRFFAIEKALPAAKPIIKAHADEIWPAKRSGDFAQALMDIGASICKPKAPLCLLCPLPPECAAQKIGAPEAFPVKPPKKKKPHRKGAAFALVNKKGEVLFERRPEKGLLGAMLGLPGTPWREAEERAPLDHAPAKTAWTLAGEAQHTFTHFHLQLDVFRGEAPKGFRRTSEQQWIAPSKAKLPTVMKKAVAALD